MAQAKAQKEVLEKVRSAFSDMDRNGDGVVTFSEFRDYCSRTVGCEGVGQMFCEIDTSNDQKITLEELTALCTKVDPKKMQECHITNLFHELDKSGDGQLDKGEFRALMAKCGYPDSTIQKTFDFIAGGDGQISLAEFLHAFKNS